MEPAKWTIIVVEDTYDDQQVVSYLLKHYGIQVFVAQNGSECLDLLEVIQPTCIVTDLAMPVRDGWQTLVAIRSQAHTARIPVIAITAYHATDVAESAIRAGFDGYFAKPLNPRSFIQHLGEIIETA